MDPARGPDRMGETTGRREVPRQSTIRGSAGVVLAIASVASFMAALDTLVVTTALTTIREDLGASLAQLEWTVNAFNLTFAVLLMTAAVVGDRVGRRRAFAGGVALFTAASAACALSTSAGALIAARAVQGVGAAAVLTLSFTLVSAAYPPERRGAALGIFFSVTGLAVASGPLIGGAVAESLDWHWIFWLNVPIGLVLAPVAADRDAREPRPARAARSAGTRARLGRRPRPRVGPGARRRRRLGQRAGGRRPRRRRAAARPVRGVGVARPGADGAARVLPLAGVRGRQRRDPPGDGVAVLRRLLPGPVHADGTRVGAAGGGPAPAAVDRDAVRGGADRRSAGRPLGRAPLPDRGAAAPGGGDGLDRASWPGRGPATPP